MSSNLNNSASNVEQHLDFQGKLFVTVIQAQNLTIKQEKSVAGHFVGALSSPLLQGIEKIQSFSTTHVKKLAPIFTVPGTIINTIIGGKEDGNAETSATKKEDESIGVVCSVTMSPDQVFKTKRSSNIVEPAWNESYSFNVHDPCARLDIVVELLDPSSTTGNDFIIGHAQLSIDEEIHLFGQKPVAKWINITKRVTKEGEAIDDQDIEFYRDDEIVGRVELQLQYKYRKVWDCVYHGKMLYFEKKYEDALDQLHEAIEKNPTNPKLYSTIVDCHLALKQYVKAIENSVNIIKHDPKSSDGNLKTAKVLMESGQLEKAQIFLDKAAAISKKSERVSNTQYELNHLVEVDKLNKLIEQGFNEFNNNDLTTASDTFTKAIEINPHSPILYELRALCFVAAKNIPAAIADTNKILDIDHNWPKTNPTMSGYMMKDGQINVMAKKRWFTLKSVFLFYFKEQSEMVPQGVICLTDFGCAPKPGQKVKFQIKTRDREYYLKVDNQPDEFDKWVSTLTKISKTKLKLPPLKASQEQIVWRNIYTSKQQQQQQGFVLPDVMMLPETLFVESGRFAFSIGDKIKAKFSSIAQSECSRVGWLYKMGQVNKGWQKRYFLIHKDTLYYAKVKDGDESAPSITPTGILPLEGAKVDMEPEGIAKANSFSINTALRRNFVLAADSLDSKEKWVKAIYVAAGIIPVDKSNPNSSGGGDGETGEKKEAEIVPSSDQIFANRSRRIKSLRAPPKDDEIQKKLEEERKLQQQQQQQRRIGTNEMSNSESKYFDKFNLTNDNDNYVPPPIISSKNFSQNSFMANSNGYGNLNSSTSGTNNTSYSAQNSPSIRSSNTNNPTTNQLSSVLNDDQDTLGGDDGTEETGLVSGKQKKSVNDSNEIDQDSDKRCCKCTIQ